MEEVSMSKTSATSKDGTIKISKSTVEKKYEGNESRKERDIALSPSITRTPPNGNNPGAMPQGLTYTDGIFKRTGECNPKVISTAIGNTPYEHIDENVRNLRENGMSSNQKNFSQTGVTAAEWAWFKSNRGKNMPSTQEGRRKLLYKGFNKTLPNKKDLQDLNGIINDAYDKKEQNRFYKYAEKERNGLRSLVYKVVRVISGDSSCGDHSECDMGEAILAEGKLNLQSLIDKHKYAKEDKAKWTTSNVASRISQISPKEIPNLQQYSRPAGFNEIGSKVVSGDQSCGDKSECDMSATVGNGFIMGKDKSDIDEYFGRGPKSDTKKSYELSKNDISRLPKFEGSKFEKNKASMNPEALRRISTSGSKLSKLLGSFGFSCGD